MLSSVKLSAIMPIVIMPGGMMLIVFVLFVSMLGV
jgi:hypothetical protein